MISKQFLSSSICQSFHSCSVPRARRTAEKISAGRSIVNILVKTAKQEQTLAACNMESTGRIAPIKEDKSAQVCVPLFLACFGGQSCAPPVEPSRRQRPLHHSRVGKRCKPLGAQLPKQTVQFDPVPSVALQPSAKRQVRVRVQVEHQTGDEGREPLRPATAASFGGWNHPTPVFYVPAYPQQEWCV